jgi:hypothetical protein
MALKKEINLKLKKDIYNLNVCLDKCTQMAKM